MKIVGVSGMTCPLSRPNRGERTTDLLLRDLAASGYAVCDVPLPATRFLRTRSRRRQRRLGERIARLSEPGDVAIAHSMGCLHLLRAMEAGAQYSLVFLFRPAMHTDYIFPYLGLQRGFVIHARNDEALAAGSKLIRHDFGMMGALGYDVYLDPRFVNIEVEIKRPNHAADFSDAFRDIWVEFIHAQIRDYLSAQRARCRCAQTQALEVAHE